MQYATFLQVYRRELLPVCWSPTVYAYHGWFGSQGVSSEQALVLG